MKKVEIDVLDCCFTIKAIPGYLRFSHCRGCNSTNVKKIVSIGKNVRVPFCGKKSCEEKVINQSIEMYREILIDENERKKRKQKKEKNNFGFRILGFMRFIFNNI